MAGDLTIQGTDHENRVVVLAIRLPKTPIGETILDITWGVSGGLSVWLEPHEARRLAEELLERLQERREP